MKILNKFILYLIKYKIKCTDQEKYQENHREDLFVDQEKVDQEKVNQEKVNQERVLN